MGLQVRRLLLMIAATLIPFSLQSCQREFSKAPARTNQSTADSSSPATDADNQTHIERDGMVLIKGGICKVGRHASADRSRLRICGARRARAQEIFVER